MIFKVVLIIITNTILKIILILAIQIILTPLPALGYYAKYICDYQSYNFGLGLNSPLSKLLNLSL